MLPIRAWTGAHCENGDAMKTSKTETHNFGNHRIFIYFVLEEGKYMEVSGQTYRSLSTTLKVDLSQTRYQYI